MVCYRNTKITTRGDKMRVNFYLSENNPKEKEIIEFLNAKLHSTNWIKETLYQFAQGATYNENIKAIKPKEIIEFRKETYEKIEEPEEEYEEIIGIENIEFDF